LTEFDAYSVVDVRTTDPSDGLSTLAPGAPDRSADTLHIREQVGARQRTVTLPRFLEVERLLLERATAAGVGTDAVRNGIPTALAGIAWGADALVTGRPDLLALSDDEEFVYANLMSPDAACGLLGLFLRARRDYTTDPAIGNPERPPYWLLAQQMLPAGWRWHEACWKVAPTNEVLWEQAKTTFRRVADGLRARDGIAMAYQLPAGPTAEEEAPFFLDAMLVSFAAAFDGAAQVAHAAYALTASTVGWTQKAWLRELARAEPALAALAKGATPGGDVMTLIRVLRNSIHGPGTDSHTWPSRTHRPRVQISVPERHRGKFDAAVKRQGGDAAWGIRVRSAEFVGFDAFEFTEQLVPRALTALDEMMATTDVDRLLPPGELPIEQQAPAGGRWTGAPDAQERLRLLSGLG
jgi:hypothetical protein